MFEDIERTAKALYQLSLDMDYADCDESKAQILDDIKQALCQIVFLAKNPLNADYWRTFTECLIQITELTDVNEAYFREEN